MRVPAVHACPACGAGANSLGYRVESAPAHTVVLYPTRDTAAEVARGTIELAECPKCGLVFNSDFQPEKLHYTENYEATQAFSDVFNAFNASLATEVFDHLNDPADVVVEVGCGQGEFLTLLENLGARKLIGFDPAFDPSRSAIPTASQTRILALSFSASSVIEAPAAIICKMTLEHIWQPRPFLAEMVKLASRGLDCTIFLQVPNGREVFVSGAFWDVYYEHCNYFSSESIVALCQSCGLQVLDCRTAYDNQYLLLSARLADKPQAFGRAPKSTAISIQKATELAGAWSNWATDQADGSIALWGGGSKAVAFVTSLRVSHSIRAAIDINPRKRGTYLPGSGLPVISPEDAAKLELSDIVVLNPVYLEEIRNICSAVGIKARLQLAPSPPVGGRRKRVQVNV